MEPSSQGFVQANTWGMKVNNKIANKVFILFLLSFFVRELMKIANKVPIFFTKTLALDAMKGALWVVSISLFFLG